MLVHTKNMLFEAKDGKYALGAFNVYNLEGALSVIQAAQDMESPVILQILPSALEIGGSTLIRLCLEAGKSAKIPVAVHLDHCSSKEIISSALDAGISSVMADGSMLDFEANINFTQKIVSLSHQFNAGVEAELGRLTGEEDKTIISGLKEKLTQPEQAKEFAQITNVSALAVCIGNIHGKYINEPDLDFDRLAAINKIVPVPLVLHGTSGLPDQMIKTSIRHGVCKFNVNTEIRNTYLNTLNQLFKDKNPPELVDVMKETIGAMTQPIKEKIRLFGSANKADNYKNYTII